MAYYLLLGSISQVKLKEQAQEPLTAAGEREDASLDIDDSEEELAGIHNESRSNDLN